MSSNTAPGRHLDATQREVVYCWNCRNEWYREEQEGLACPRCHGDITEIITPGEADPREPEPQPARDHHAHEDDSDPDEGDIEEHIHDLPHGFFMRRTNPHPDVGSPRSDNNHRPNNPDEEVMRDFHDMLFTFQGGIPPRAPQAPGQREFAPGPEHRDVHVAGPHRIQARTWRAGPMEVSTISMIIPGGPGMALNEPGDNGGPGNFDAFFQAVLGPQLQHGAHGEGQQGQQGPPAFPGLLGGLSRILASVVDPARAVHGDAVYTQEALDRIITQMMEANPQSNAAPPASQEAISKLPTRKLEDKDMGNDGRAECTICIDDLHPGDEVTVLPCKHWFHGECVTLWLKEHNTCPICRTPIEANNNNNNNQNNSRRGSGQAQQQQQPPQPPQAPWSPFFGLASQASQQQQQQPGQQQQHGQQQQQRQYQAPFAEETQNQGSPTAREPQNARSRYGAFRTRMDNEERLAAIRNLGGVGDLNNQSRNNNPSMPSAMSGSRRSSMSPPPDPSPRVFRSRSQDRDGGNYRHGGGGAGWSFATLQGAQDQQQNNNRNDDRQGGNSSAGGGGGGPISWIRNQLTRSGSGSGSGNGNGNGQGSGDNRPQ